MSSSDLLGVVQLHELFKNASLVCGLDAHAAVAALQAPGLAALRTPCRQQHGPLRGVAQSVAQQVAQDAPQQHRVGLHPGLALSRLQATAQFFQRRDLFGLTLFPGPEQLGERFAVGLRSELAQGLLRPSGRAML